MDASAARGEKVIGHCWTLFRLGGFRRLSSRLGVTRPRLVYKVKNIVGAIRYWAALQLVSLVISELRAPYATF